MTNLKWAKLTCGFPICLRWKQKKNETNTFHLAFYCAKDETILPARKKRPARKRRSDRLAFSRCDPGATRRLSCRIKLSSVNKSCLENWARVFFTLPLCATGIKCFNSLVCSPQGCASKKQFELFVSFVFSTESKTPAQISEIQWDGQNMNEFFFVFKF